MRRGCLVADDELVLGRAAGVLAGLGDQRAMRRQPGLATADRFLVKRGSTKIIAHHAGGLKIDRACGIAFAGFRHQVSLLQICRVVAIERRVG